MYSGAEIEQYIVEFQVRMETELEYCEELFRHATIRLLAAKYAYYEANNAWMEDVAYDLCEKGWFVMGRALGHLKEDETSPCVDFNREHLLAAEATALAKKLMRK